MHPFHSVSISFHQFPSAGRPHLLVGRLCVSHVESDWIKWSMAFSLRWSTEIETGICIQSTAKIKKKSFIPEAIETSCLMLVIINRRLLSIHHWMNYTVRKTDKATAQIVLLWSIKNWIINNRVIVNRLTDWLFYELGQLFQRMARCPPYFIYTKITFWGLKGRVA